MFPSPRTQPGVWRDMTSLPPGPRGMADTGCTGRGHVTSSISPQDTADRGQCGTGYTGTMPPHQGDRNTDGPQPERGEKEPVKELGIFQTTPPSGKSVQTGLC